MRVINKKIIAVTMLLVLEIVLVFLTYKSYGNKLVDEIKNIDRNSFAMYIENEDGDYEEYIDSSYFPTDTHELNYTLTTCVDNKGKEVDNKILSYVDGKVTATSNKTVFCYLYFEYLPVVYAIYSATDNSLTFYNNKDIEGINNIYNSKEVTELYTGFENSTSIPWSNSEYLESIKSIAIVDEISPISTSGWFSGMVKVESLDLTNLNTAKITNMASMFRTTGKNAAKFEISGIENWNTSSVVNMDSMFYETAQQAESLV